MVSINFNAANKFFIHESQNEFKTHATYSPKKNKRKLLCVYMKLCKLDKKKIYCGFVKNKILNSLKKFQV